MPGTVYLGLCVTYHDPALALVSETGEVLFAQATERSLQYKRGLNCEPDDLYELPKLLDEFAPGADRLVVAGNWRLRRPLYETLMAALGILNADGLSRLGIKRLRSPLQNAQIHHMMACNRRAIRRRGLNLALWRQTMRPELATAYLDFDHHLTHAASACFASGFDDAVCAVVDSYGEHGAVAFYRFAEGRLTPLHIARGLGSLGLFFMRLTELCGFDWMKGEEWKVMGLASYGKVDNELLTHFRRTLRVDGLGLSHPKATMFQAFESLQLWRRLHADSLDHTADLARTGQAFFEEIMTSLLTELHARTGVNRLVLAGGCALNSAYNGKICGETPFESLYVPPAPADDGTAIGAAWLAWLQDHPGARLPERQLSPYLGSEMSDDGLTRLIRYCGLQVEHFPGSIAAETARQLAAGRLVGWIQGRAEFGPRALGHRSILADPRDPTMKDRINACVKFREEFRPFAPAILHEHGPQWFEGYRETPYMEAALPFRAAMRERVPAVVHVDGTGRLQSVTRHFDSRFHELLSAFHAETGVPILLNTSFNVMGKPIAHAVEDAISVFSTSGLDRLVIGDYLFSKPSP